MPGPFRAHPANARFAPSSPLYCGPMGILAFDSTDTAVQTAIDIATPLVGALIGVLAGVVLAFVVGIASRLLFRRSRVISAMLRRARGATYWTAMVWGAYIGAKIALIDQSVSAATNASRITLLQRILFLLAIAMTTWLAYSAAWVVQDAARLRSSADQGRARRFETQAQVLRRALQAIIVIVGIFWALFTFPETQKVVGGVLASAGVISVIAGLAAQATLGNVFAGIQLAFTDAIRVGDVVVVGVNKDQGAIEEITLTYVVVRVWDERRLIIPSSQFATNQFENWTRRATRQLGTLELTLDWAAPVAQIRERVEHLLLSTDLWDGRTWNVQVTGSDRDSVTVRVLVSAKDSGSLWDLRCYLREKLISWLATDEAWTRPTARYQEYTAVTVQHDPSREMVARLATELSGIAGGDTAAGTPGTDEGGADLVGGQASSADGGSDAGAQTRVADAAVDAVHAARLTASRRKAKRARRHKLQARQRDVAEGRSPAATPSASAAGGERTRVFTPQELQVIAQRFEDQEPATGSGGTSEVRPGRDAVVRDGGPVSSPRVVRRSVAEELKLPPRPLGMDIADSPDSGTAVFPPTATAGGRGERLYSGSPDAEERSRIFDGPGEEAIAEREEAARANARKGGTLGTGGTGKTAGDGEAAGTAGTDATTPAGEGRTHPDGASRG